MSVQQFVGSPCHVVTRATPDVTSVDRGRMANYLKPAMVPARRRVGDPTMHAATIAKSLAMTDPIVDSVHLRVTYAAPIPGVPNLATSLVHHARRIVHGRALTLEDAIYLAQFLATNCHARNAARKSSNVGINVPLCVGRPARRLITARFAVQRKPKVSWWTMLIVLTMARQTSMKIRASCQIVGI
jgi:hypothetical protein